MTHRTQARSRGHFAPRVERLETRYLPASRLFLDAASGELAVLGDGGENVAVVTRTAGTFTVTLDGVRHEFAVPRSLRFAGGAGRDRLVLGDLSLDQFHVTSDDVVEMNGRLAARGFTLTADGLVTIDAAAELRATGAVAIRARSLVQAGSVTGGSIDVACGAGYHQVRDAVVSGGRVMIDAGRQGNLFASGRIDATGGEVRLLGRSVSLVGAAVDAGVGGTILVGGDYQGKNPAVPNATSTFVGADATLRAGRSGRVIVWADGRTEFHGTAAAPGGLVEVSGKGDLTFAGHADAGQLLLDPKNIVVSATAGTYPYFSLTDPNPDAGDPFGASLTVLENGNLVACQPGDGFGGANAGAVYLFDGRSGALISTLVGEAGDRVGVNGATALTNGHFVVLSPRWNGSRGAATRGSGITGISGTVSASNSLVGSSALDNVGSNAVALTNGNYVVLSPGWNNGRGAATWGSGSPGAKGTISPSNSLVGSAAGDVVGDYGAVALTNGNYVVRSTYWNDRRGAATWGSGTGGTVGAVSSSNSIVGSSPGDLVAFPGVTALKNGNYVVRSMDWNDGRGAATWGNGAGGTTGAISSSNSLVGSSPNDEVGRNGVRALTNGNYVVLSPTWNGERGAATWGSGTAGVKGTISSSNSLVGSSANDNVGITATALTNGHYVVGSRGWNSGRGAATWGSGSSGVKGTISASNSLVGSSVLDGVGEEVVALTNGNYVVLSPDWSDQRGAATWGNGASGAEGVVSSSNSLVAFSTGSRVGGGGALALANGNYVVLSPDWAGGVGAATWGNGSTAVGGVEGQVSSNNSLIGDDQGDAVGSGGVALTNGNYVVSSPAWNGRRGAATWGNGSSGIKGPVNQFNSLVGSDPGDNTGTITALTNGNYVVVSPGWSGGRGAATWSDGTTGEAIDGFWVVSARNSILGQNSSSDARAALDDDPADSFVFRLPGDGTGRVVVGHDRSDPNRLTFAVGQSSTVTISPKLLTGLLSAGTAIRLQASNDITIDTGFTVNNPNGSGGALTLQAGRSVVLNGSIVTDDGALTIIANDHLAGGVIDAQRDPGLAAITTGNSVTLNSGAATMTIELRAGEGKTNRSAGGVRLDAVTATSLSVSSVGSVSIDNSVSVSKLATFAAGPGGLISLPGNNSLGMVAVASGDTAVIRANSAVTLAASSVTSLISLNVSGVVRVGGPVVGNVTGDSGDDRFVFLPGSSVSGTLLGGGGLNSLDYSQQAAGVAVNLQAGTASLTGAVSGFRDVFGGAGPDTLVGDGQNNLLVGFGGDDTLNGVEGDDQLNGGEGSDRLFGGAGNDSYIFLPAAAAETDTAFEGPGGGFDSLHFSSLPLTVPVTVNLSNANALAAHANRTVKAGGPAQAAQFENAYGGAAADVLIGNDASNVLIGNGGDDRLNGLAGNDAHVGGAGGDTYVFNLDLALGSDVLDETFGDGTDTIDFSPSTARGATIDLGATAAQAVSAGRLVLTLGGQVERVIGGALGDRLTGNAANNVLLGGGGEDVLLGKDGRDFLVGGLGADSLFGGDGEDILIAGGTTQNTPAALDAIMAEWTGLANYRLRVDRLRGVAPGGLNGGVFLKVGTVINDGGAADSLFGSLMQDWFLRSAADAITDPNSGGPEVVTPIA